MNSSLLSRVGRYHADQCAVTLIHRSRDSDDAGNNRRGGAVFAWVPCARGYPYPPAANRWPLLYSTSVRRVIAAVRGIWRMAKANEAPIDGDRSDTSLLKECWAQIRTVPGIIGVALLGMAAATIAFLIVASPGFAVAVFVAAEDHSRTIIITAAVLLGAAVATVAATFFQGAVVSAALQQSAGERTSPGRAIAGARNRLARLLQWGAVAATINVLLALVRDRGGAAGSILSAAGGLAWGVASYLAIPAVITEDLGPFDAVKRSSNLIKRTWGSALRVNVRFWFILLPAFLLAFVLLICGGFVMGAVDETLGAGVMIVGIVILVIGLAFSSTLKAYIATQLYLHAAGQDTRVSADLLQGAIRTA